MKPSLGRIVLFRNMVSNGISEHPAIINRVWTDTCVNLTVFPDCGVPTVHTSVMQNEDILAVVHHAWRWPPRVD